MSDTPPPGELAGILVLLLVVLALAFLAEAVRHIRVMRRITRGRREALKRSHPAKGRPGAPLPPAAAVVDSARQCQREDCVEPFRFVIHGWRLCLVHGADVVTSPPLAAVVTVREPITAPEAEAIAARFVEGARRGPLVAVRYVPAEVQVEGGAQ